MRTIQSIYALILLACGLAVGWFLAQFSFQAPPETLSKFDDPQASSEWVPVRVQGRLIPQSGVVNVYAPPNQRIDQILVQAGQTIMAGETELAKFHGQETLQLQAELAQSQTADTRSELAQKIELAAQQQEAAIVAVRLAELKLEQAQQQDSIAIPTKQLASARAKLARLETLAADPKTEAFVAQAALEDQRLSIDEAQIQLTQATRQQAAMIQAAELELQAATLNLRQAQVAHAELLKLQDTSRTPDLSEALAQTTARDSRLMAPIDGVVLRVNARQGEVVMHTPIMQVANVSRMDCIAEVPDRLVGQIKPGQPATISSPALPRTLSGEVVAVERIVGTGNLIDPNPLALVDRRTVDVHVRLQETDTEIAAQLIHLQVTVTFEENPLL